MSNQILTIKDFVWIKIVDWLDTILTNLYEFLMAHYKGIDRFISSHFFSNVLAGGCITVVTNFHCWPL